jgi:hypothetical protein
MRLILGRQFATLPMCTQEHAWQSPFPWIALRLTISEAQVYIVVLVVVDKSLIATFVILAAQS